MEEDKKEEKKLSQDEKVKMNKKIKNLISAVILLGGLFVGSLFVDISQIVKGTGFSAKNLNKSDVFESGGKTWVAYTDPAVSAMAINDDTCDKCDISDALVWLRRVVPTVSIEKVDYNSDKGKELINKYGIKVLPAFIFDQNVAKTDFYAQAAALFTKKDDQYALATQELGIPAGKYLELPQIKDGDAIFGKEDSNVKVVLFSDFQCPYCKVLYTSLRGVMKSYSDKVLFDYKHLPLSIHPQSENAALASDCALEQGKFWEYTDKLYANQSDLASVTDALDTSKLKTYARTLGLKTADFNQCLDDKKFQDKINADKDEAASFGISGTPAIFINDQFFGGAISTEQLKSAIDSELNK